MAKALPIRHIGIFSAICDRRRKANLRTDLGEERYRQLGVKERHLGEAPYRICPKCIGKLPTLWKDEMRYRKRRDRKVADRRSVSG